MQGLRFRRVGGRGTGPRHVFWGRGWQFHKKGKGSGLRASVLMEHRCVLFLVSNAYKKKRMPCGVGIGGVQGLRFREGMEQISQLGGWRVQGRPQFHKRGKGSGAGPWASVPGAGGGGLRVFFLGGVGGWGRPQGRSKFRN